MPQCRIRQDILEQALAVPVGDTFIDTAEPLEYQYDENDVIWILWDDEWQEGVGTDYEFLD